MGVGGKIIGCIQGLPLAWGTREDQKLIYFVDLLCIHSEYRKKNLAPFLISSLAQRGIKVMGRDSAFLFKIEGKKLPFRETYSFQNYYLEVGGMNEEKGVTGGEYGYREINNNNNRHLKKAISLFLKDTDPKGVQWNSSYLELILNHPGIILLVLTKPGTDHSTTIQGAVLCRIQTSVVDKKKKKIIELVQIIGDFDPDDFKDYLYQKDKSTDTWTIVFNLTSRDRMKTCLDYFKDAKTESGISVYYYFYGKYQKPVKNLNLFL